MKSLPYSINIRWEEPDGVYVARVPALRGCLAIGDTPEEAAREIQVVAGLWLRVAAEEKKPIPEPDLLPLARIEIMKPVLNLSALARAAGMSMTTLASKLNRQTELSEAESLSLADALGRYGLLTP